MLFICPIKVTPSLHETQFLYKFSLQIFLSSKTPCSVRFIPPPHPAHWSLWRAGHLGGQQEQLRASWPQLQHGERILFSKTSDTQFQCVTTHQVCRVIMSRMSFTESRLFLESGSQTAAFFSSFPSIRYKTLDLVFIRKTTSFQIAFFGPIKYERSAGTCTG